MITITRNGIVYPVDGERYYLTHSRLVVDGRDVPFPWFAPARRSSSIVGLVLALVVSLSHPLVTR